MKENLLHFIWKLKLFSVTELVTTKGKSIEIIHGGIENLNSGPDFSNAKIRIDNQLWAGTVEIHLSSSDWYVHNHEIDARYNSVILHVVWNHDVEIFRNTNEPISTLELKQYISKNLLDRYYDLFKKTKKWINCENEINQIDSFVMNHWVERLYFERLAQKSYLIENILAKNKNNWEATLFSSLAKNFGLKINGDAFMSFATSFNFSDMRKIASNYFQLEALFFGQAGLLFADYESDYFQRMKNEYAYLQVKFKLKPISENRIQFFRLRPYNFPTIRLSQLSFLYNKQQNLFSKLMEIKSIEEFYNLFSITTSLFWETHYTFEKESKQCEKKLSKSFIDLLLINTIIPIKFLYLKSIGKSDFSSLLAIIEHIKPEKNTVISNFNRLNVKSDNAFKTQALLQLKSEYCTKQHCLRCLIGKEILKN